MVLKQERMRLSFISALLCQAALINAEVLKIFFLAGQSNQEGHAEVATVNKSSGTYFNGTLAYQLTDPRTSALFAPLWDPSTKNWTVLPDIKVWFNECGSQQGVNGSSIPSMPGDASFGNLTVGYGTGADSNLIGPELGFGFGMHDALPGQKILVMKTAWGGKSLAVDYRPPSSVANPDPFCQGDCPNVVGHYYETMVADVHKMLAPGAVAAMYPVREPFISHITMLSVLQVCNVTVHVCFYPSGLGWTNTHTSWLRLVPWMERWVRFSVHLK